MTRETERQRDERIRGVLREAREDYAMHEVAIRLDLDPQPLADCFWSRLECLGVADLARAVALLLGDDDTIAGMADIILRGLDEVSA